jgi:hypothetical protein
MQGKSVCREEQEGIWNIKHWKRKKKANVICKREE